MALKGIGLNGKAEIHMRKLKMWLLGLAAAAMLSVSACAQEIPEESLNGNGSVSAEENQAESADGDSQAVSSSENGGNRVSSASGTSFNLADVPAYSGQPYVAVNGNVPYFTDADLTDVSFESYSDLDSLGRCGVAYASVSPDTMPTEKRGSIGEVKPTGWHMAKYDNVDGKYLYNRCHLIGYQLTAENANVKNLITGTRYLNVQGMLPFENLTADYVKETGNHVMYRVTPVFEGDNLVASGVLMEAESVEDQGEGVLFCVYVYNVQRFSRRKNMIIKDVNLETVCGITSKLPANTQPEFAFAGKSNVGKSSLINALMNRRSYARTSSQPGKTQTINFYHINDAFYYVDLPGYGYARASVEVKAKWGKMIENYLHKSQMLRCVFLLIDIRHEPSSNDKLMYDWIVSQGFQPILIATKADKIKRSQLQKQLKILRTGLGVGTEVMMIPFSAETKQGREEIWNYLETEIWKVEHPGEEMPMESADGEK